MACLVRWGYDQFWRFFLLSYFIFPSLAPLVKLLETGFARPARVSCIGLSYLLWDLLKYIYCLFLMIMHYYVAISTRFFFNICQRKTSTILLLYSHLYGQWITHLFINFPKLHSWEKNRTWCWIFSRFFFFSLHCKFYSIGTFFYVWSSLSLVWIEGCALTLVLHSWFLQ